MSAAPIQKMVATEGARIYCEYRGRGPLLLLITGAMEDAGFYSSAADILSGKFTVLSYDRRCNSRSSGDRSADMTVAQQARDAAAIIEAMGADHAPVLGRSGGAIIGLELAATKPELIDTSILDCGNILRCIDAGEQEIMRECARGYLLLQLQNETETCNSLTIMYLAKH
jgi:pimeloyl-ACP methyl ester carboxylesterase